MYVDTSVLVKLYVDERDSRAVREAVDQAEVLATSTIAYVEARAAFARKRREGGLRATDHRRIVRALDDDWPRFFRIDADEALVRHAGKLAESFRLRAYDAVHLASALAFSEASDAAVVFACRDVVLERAATRAGFESLPT